MTTRSKKSKPRQKRKPSAPEKNASDLVTGDRKAKLGTKHVCYSCQTRFYDLNKPEPLCPKCGADQRSRPKVKPGSAPPPAPVKRPPPRPMPGLLDDEEESVPSFEDEMDIDLGELDSGGEELFEEDADTPEPADEEPEEG